ncbi:four helix bundle protein [Niabella soli]|uniref:30S ribosomal protein S23 n=1 Tax=Niabella soli DSM 19437 TaxID=929713 RepID=W0F2N7_9BACT|nr:four helix bundle protein [Niabella soli]AHF16068.1 30S ribosomal protein S23 [Niabella soli DSM 19437]
MSTILKFEELDIWQQARKLSLEIFKTTSVMPFASDFRFRDQVRAAAGSAMDNIAEGFERSSRLEFVNFPGFSKGSCGEVKSQLYRALDQNYISKELFNHLCERYTKLCSGIAAFIIYLNKAEARGLRFKDRNQQQTINKKL